MWICRNCGTENEDNFKFCWSCGRTQEKSKPVEIKQEILEIPKGIEPKKEPVRAIGKIEESEKPEEIINPEEPKPIEPAKVEKRKSPYNEPELFATVLPYPAKNFSSNDETDWEIKVFRIAVRLVGLFLLYQFLIALPDMIVLIYSSVKNTQNFSDALTSDLIIPAVKLLFYFIVGVYLIASGRIVIRLLPDG